MSTRPAAACARRSATRSRRTQLAATSWTPETPPGSATSAPISGWAPTARSRLTATDVAGARASPTRSICTRRASTSASRRSPTGCRFYLDQFLAPGSSLEPRGLRALQRRRRQPLPQGRAPLPAVRLAPSGRWRVRAHESGVSMSGIGHRRRGRLGQRSADRVRFAASNGTFGGPEVDRRKQFSLQTEYVTTHGGSALPATSMMQRMAIAAPVGLFAGLLTGPVSWLAESTRSRTGRSSRPLAGRNDRRPGCSKATGASCKATT